MSYDTTAPVKVNETRSLLLMLLLLALVGGGIWVALYLNKPAKPAPANATAAAPVVTVFPEPDPRRQPPPRPQRRRPTPAQRPADSAPEGISHPRANVTLIRAGATYVTITVNPANKNVNVSRSHPRDEKAALWVTANAALQIAHDPKTAEHYEATPDQVAALDALHLAYPQLGSVQQQSLRDLFNAMQDAKPEERPAAEKALGQAVAGMPISLEDEKSFEAAVAKARGILRADQLDLIDNSL